MGSGGSLGAFYKLDSGGQERIQSYDIWCCWDFNDQLESGSGGNSEGEATSQTFREWSREAMTQWRNGKQRCKWRVLMLEAAGIGGGGDLVRYWKRRGSE
jgi:hypothetical protein